MALEFTLFYLDAKLSYLYVICLWEVQCFLFGAGFLTGMLIPERSCEQTQVFLWSVLIDITSVSLTVITGKHRLSVSLVQFVIATPEKCPCHFLPGWLGLSQWSARSTNTEEQGCACAQTDKRIQGLEMATTCCFTFPDLSSKRPSIYHHPLTSEIFEPLFLVRVCHPAYQICHSPLVYHFSSVFTFLLGWKPFSLPSTSA